MAKFTKLIPYTDAAGLPEDERIRMIGEVCMGNPGRNVGIVVELIEDGGIFGMKGDRYIRKLNERFPSIVVMNRGNLTDGSDGSELIRVQFPQAPKGHKPHGTDPTGKG